MRVLAFAVLLLAMSAAPAFASHTHIVQSGETLWTLAARYDVSVDAIARANRLPNVDRLQLGQRLLIPDRAPRRDSSRAAIRTTPYRVREGDTLWALAHRFAMSVDDLAALNGIGVEGTLQIGQVLRVKAAAPAPIPTPTPPVSSVQRAAAVRGASAVTPRRVSALPYRGAAWADSLIGLARRFIGTRYRWGATGPNAFDCSGFLQYVFTRRGISLPRTTYAMFQAGRRVPAGELLPGDLVFFTTYRPGPSHAGIFLGNGLFIHSSSGYGSVTITPLHKDYYHKRYLGARRF